MDLIEKRRGKVWVHLEVLLSSCHRKLYGYISGAEHRAGIYSRLSLSSRASALSRHDLPFQYTSSMSNPLMSAKNAHSVIIHPEMPSQHGAQYPLTVEPTIP